jgi:hypothetical protein
VSHNSFRAREGREACRERYSVHPLAEQDSGKINKAVSADCSIEMGEL